MKQALLVIDMQNGFLNPESPLCIRDAQATVPACAAVIAGCREAGVPVVFINRAYRPDGSDVEHTRRKVWEEGGKPLTPGSTGPLSVENPPEFDRRPEDYEIIKPRYSAFFQTELDLLLRRLGVDTVILTGTTTPNCIRTTCYDAISLDYKVTVVADCCSSNTEKIQRANLLDMGNVGAEILDAKALLETLVSSRPGPGQHREIPPASGAEVPADTADLTVGEMLSMQCALQKKYQDKWKPLSPDVGKNMLLWLLGEAGEVIDVIKKDGYEQIMADEAVRAHFIEELADILMYYHDILLCYRISPKELRQIYTAKFRRNMERW